MNRFITRVMALVLTLVCCLQLTITDSISGTDNDLPRTGSSEPFLLSLPEQTGPVVVWAHFELHDINEINDEAETFEFAGVLTLKWHDPRQAFDPAVAGAKEKIFQGNYQFNELSPSWYPQYVLFNESGLYQKNGVILRVQPNGTSTLVETLNAVAKSAINLRKFPFDGHRLEAIFEVLGFDKDEVILKVESDTTSDIVRKARVPEWIVTGYSLSVRDRPASPAGQRGGTSALVLSVDVKRKPFYIVRLVFLPLIIIVLLSFSVFWMDRSTIGDRLSVSFIGILTAVAYQLMVSDQLPSISYFTLIHGFLNLSFYIMCATVVINLVVASLDKKGKSELGDRLDCRCRWAFPLVYFGLLFIMFGVAMLFF